MSSFLTAETSIFLLRGLGVTLIIAASSIVLSFIFGSVLGIARFTGVGFSSKIAAVYIDTVRNIPLLLFIIGLRFTLPLPPVISAIAAMTIFTSAMVAEIVRGGLNSISRGQWEAAYSQGFSFTGTLVHVVLPQAVRKIRKPLMGQFVTAIKDTSFCSVIAVKELMYSGTIIMGKYVKSSQVIALYGVIALVYFCVNMALLGFSRKMIKEQF
jgi:aspartate/glutamate/glutamine transport system permease protein